MDDLLSKYSVIVWSSMAWVLVRLLTGWDLQTSNRLSNSTPQNQEFVNRLLAKSDENDIEFRIIRPDGSGAAMN